MTYNRYIEILDIWCDTTQYITNRAKHIAIMVKNNPITIDEVKEFFAYKDRRDELNRITNNKEG